jgi:hypothetical protein
MVDNRQVPKTLYPHQPHRIFHGCRGPDVLRILCHDARYRRRFRIKPLVDDPDEDIPLRKDTPQPVVFDHRKRADLKFTHHADRCGNGIRRRYGVHGLVLLNG